MKNSNQVKQAVLATGCILSWIVFVAGCATSTEVVHRAPALSEWPAPVKATPGVEQSPPMPAAEQTPVASPGSVAVISRPVLPTNIITDLELTDEADVATILRTLAKSVNINMLVSPDVTGRMRFAFRDIPWDQAFKSVISTAGLTYMWEGNVLRVMTLSDIKRNVEMETLLKEQEDVRAELKMVEPMIMKVIRLKHAKATTVGFTINQLIMAQIKENVTTDVASQARVRKAPNFVKFDDKYVRSDLMEASLESFQLSQYARFRISVDSINNAIIVHAVPDDVEKVAALVSELDVPKSQVQIEARIVEATRDTARQLGIQWGGTLAMVQDGRQITTGGKGITANGYNADFAAQFAQSITPPTAGFSLGMISERIGGSELLSMQLSALQQRGRLQIVSSPSIKTLDNEAAIIESGEERAYRKTTGTGNEADVTVEWKKATLSLAVIPHVVDEGNLHLEIFASKDSFDESKPQSNNEFPVNTKRASTSVVLRDGETIVIGGLSMETDGATESGVPYLMDIPGLGYLFKSKGTSRKFDETLIFITPKIITTLP